MDRVLDKDGKCRSDDHSQHPPDKNLFQLDREVIPDVNKFPIENFHALFSLPIDLLTLDFLVAGAPDMLLFCGSRGILCHHAHQFVGNIGFFQIETSTRVETRVKISSGVRVSSTALDAPSM